MHITKLNEALSRILYEDMDLKTRWEMEMKNYPVIETAQGEIYLQPSEDGKSIQYGTMTNGGMIVEGEIEYESDKSLDYHIQGLADVIFEKYGYPEMDENSEDDQYAKLCKKAYEDLENIQTYLENNAIDPANNRMDKSTDLFYNRITDMIDELHSQTLYLNEAIGDVIRQNKTLKKNIYTQYDEGEFTFEMMGIPLTYKLYRSEVTDSGEGEDLEDDQKLLNGYRFELTSSIDELQDKINLEFKKQAKDLYGIDIKYIGGSTHIVVPSDGKYNK